MAWAAADVLDEDVSQLVPHGHAVVSRFDDGVDDLDVRASRDVDAVRVGALPWGRHSEALERHVVARHEVHVEVLAVFCRHVVDVGVVVGVEAQILIYNKKLINRLYNC